MADSAADERRRRSGRARRGTLRDEQRHLTRRRLAEAALDLFQEVGYAQVTADAIAKRAGANRATFYLHYAGKADVVVELMDTMQVDGIAIFTRAGKVDEPGREDVRVWLGEILDFWQRNRALVDANYQAMLVEPAVAQRWWAEFEAMADAMPAVWHTADGEPSDRERTRLIMALAGLERLCWFLVIGDVPLDRNTAVDILEEEWHARLGGGRSRG